MRLVKTALLVALVAMALLGLALPASAHITAFTHEVLFVDCADAGCTTFTARSVTGSITCTAGESYVITTRVTQKEDPGPGYLGRGRIKGWCNGSSQSWEAPITDQSGYLVCGEQMEVHSIARTFSGTTLDDKRSGTARFTIPPPFC